MGALVRQVHAAGGFAAVLHKGEADGGTILLVLLDRGQPARVYERMPQLDGSRAWTLSRAEDSANKTELSEWLDRRSQQDPDLWIVELDIANGERFIGIT